MRTGREFLETTALATAAAASGLFHRSALAASRAPRPAGAAAIVDWHARWVGPRVVEPLSARPSPRSVQVAMIGGAISYVAEQIQMAADEAGRPIPARRFRRVYLDTGQSGRGPRGIALAAKVFGADRILFGSDSGPTESIVPTVESVTQAALSAEEKALTFSGNAQRLLAVSRT
jgi:hypothetical protein